MKKVSIIYIIIGLLIGAIIGYLISKNQTKKTIKDIEIQQQLQLQMTGYLENIQSNLDMLNDVIYNEPYINEIIALNLIKIQELTTDQDSSSFSKAKNLVVQNYTKLQKNKLEIKRLQKLLEFYENNHTPCTFTDINVEFLFDKMIDEEKTSIEYIRKYNIPTNDLNLKKHYLTRLQFTDNLLLISGSFEDKRIVAYLVSDNNKKPIKVYQSNIKGGGCNRVMSKIYNNNILEVTEMFCKDSQTIKTQYNL